MSRNLEDLRTVLSERVRLNMISLRKRRGLRQEDFAAELGWGKHVIQRLEGGYNPWSIDKVYRVAEVFNIPPAYFFLPFTGFEEDTSLVRILRGIEATAPDLDDPVKG